MNWLETLKLKLPIFTRQAQIVPARPDPHAHLKIRCRELAKVYRAKIHKIEGLCAVMTDANQQISKLRSEAHVVLDAIAAMENEIETGVALDEPRPASYWADHSDLPLPEEPTNGR